MSEGPTVIKYFLTISLMHSFVRGVHFAQYRQEEGRTLSQTSHHNGVHISSQQYQLYSPWSQWSSCSNTCGKGISMRTRTCNKIKINGMGKNESLCHGESVEHKICQIEECPPDTPDFRLSQCIQYNNRIVAGQRAKSWVPTNGGANPCELRCEAVTEKTVYVFGKAADGTLCSDGVCLDGRCLKIGCDDRIGSGAEWDMCGLCSGRNATCVHYMDIFYGQPTSSSSGGEYQEVVVLPIGVRNFKLQKNSDDNILAMRDRSTALIFHEKTRREQQIAGTVVNYTIENNVTEVFTARGPIITELYVLVLLRSKNPGIHYQYWLPLDQSHHMRIHQVHPSYLTSTTTEHPVSQVYTDQSPLRISSKSTPIVEYNFQPTQTALRTSVYQFRNAQPTHGYPSQKRGTSKPLVSESNGPNYGPKRLGFALPLKSTVPASQNPTVSPKSSADYPVSDIFQKPLLAPGYGLSYKTRKPVFDYYEKYRNVSYHPPVDVYKRKPIYLPHQTQGDSSAPSNERNIAVSKEVDKKLKLEKKGRQFIHSKKNLSSRWEYKLNGKDNDSSGKSFLNTPVSITVLPLPDTYNASTSRKKKLKGSKHSSKSRLTRGGLCEPCQRVRDQTKHFCSSDFVIRASVLGYEFVHGETRYELEIKQSFKNILALLPREYVWSPDTCRCPKLRVGKEYVIMGKIDNNYRRNESRLLVDKSCFVRTFNLKNERRLHKLKKNHIRKCSAKVS